MALVAVAAGVMALGGVGAARSTKPKVVKLYDNYYSPVSVKISKRGKVEWKWTPVFNTHNVKLTEAPRGVRKSQLPLADVVEPDLHLHQAVHEAGQVSLHLHDPPRGDADGREGP